MYTHLRGNKGRFDEGESNATPSNTRNKAFAYIGFGVGAVILAAVLIGVLVWKYVRSRKGYKQYMNEKLTKEYASTVPDEYELTEMRL